LVSTVKSFSYDPDEKGEVMEKLTDIRWRERLSDSEVIIKAIEEYVEHHGKGNDSYTLENFVDSDFKCTPAFFGKQASWQKYLDAMSESEYKKNCKQLDVINELFNSKWKDFTHK
jgi:hypothetical protein